MKKIKFKVPIYNCTVTYIVTKDFVKSGKKLRQHIEADTNKYSGFAFSINDDHDDYVIMMKYKARKDISIIAHEVLHVVNFILEDRGIKANHKNDEAQAYLLSYILEKILRK